MTTEGENLGPVLLLAINIDLWSCRQNPRRIHFPLTGLGRLAGGLFGAETRRKSRLTVSSGPFSLTQRYSLPR